LPWHGNCSKVNQLSGPILFKDFNEADCLARGEKVMVAANPNDRIPSAGSKPVPPVKRLAERIHHYFDQHPEVSQEEFLRKAVAREIDIREQRETGKGAGLARRKGRRINRWSTERSPLSAEDVRIHAWLNERLAVLHPEQDGLWSILRRFLFGNRLMRWLGLQP